MTILIIVYAEEGEMTKQIDFLTGVLGLLKELSNKQHTAETCNGIAAVFRGEVRRLLAPEPVLSPEDFEGHPLG